MKYLTSFIEFPAKCHSVENSFSTGDGGKKVADSIENTEENKDLQTFRNNSEENSCRFKAEGMQFSHNF